jgi:predicted Zn-dependent protease with MMP-like domain
MSRAPEQSEHAERLLDQAESALDDGDADAAIRICTVALQVSPNHPGAHFVRGDALRLLGRLQDAVEAYRAAALARPDHSPSWSSLALTCFELIDVRESQRCADRSLREDPTNPEAWWVRGLNRQWRGERAGARRCFAHAAWLDPDNFRLPPTLSDDEVEGLVDEALGLLHPSLQEYLENVAVVLEEMPDAEALRTYDPPASPLDLLGFFSGASLMDRSSEDPWSGLPGTIVLFRGNLERAAGDRAELIEQLRITLYHEVGHFLGLDEDDLEARGLD